MFEALTYAVIAALGNVLGAVAVTRRAARSLKFIEYCLAFGAGFVLALAIVEILPQAFTRSGRWAPGLILLGYLLVHLTQHAVTPHFHWGEETHTVHPLAGPSALVGLLLHTFFDGVAIASAFLVSSHLGALVFLAILLHKLPEGVTISSLCVASGWPPPKAIRAAGLLGAATIVGVLFTERVAFLVSHGLALSAGVTLYVGASNLVPEFQGKTGWKLPTVFFLGVAAFYLTRALLDAAS